MLVAESTHHVGTIPRRPGDREGLNGFGHRDPWNRLGVQFATYLGDAVGDVGRCPPSSLSFRGPPRLQICDAGAGLVSSGIGGRLAGERSPFPSGGVTAFTTTKVGELGGKRRVDLRRALGERLQKLGRDANDLGLTIHDRAPRHAELVRQFAAQHGLVEAAQHSLVALQVSGVERQPTIVECLHLGRHDRVGVQLRVVGARRGLAEGCNREALGIGDNHVDRTGDKCVDKSQPCSLTFPR